MVAESKRCEFVIRRDIVCDRQSRQFGRLCYDVGGERVAQGDQVRLGLVQSRCEVRQ